MRSLCFVKIASFSRIDFKQLHERNINTCNRCVQVRQLNEELRVSFEFCLVMSSIDDDTCDCCIYQHRVFKCFYSFYKRTTSSEAMKSREWITSSTFEKRVETRINTRTINAILSFVTNYLSVRHDNRSEESISR